MFHFHRITGFGFCGDTALATQCKEVSEVTNPGVVTSVPSSTQVCTCFLQPRLWGFGECKAQPWGLCPAQYWASTEGSTSPRAGPVLGALPWSLLGHYWTSTVPVLDQYWASTEGSTLPSPWPLLRALPSPVLGHY